MGEFAIRTEKLGKKYRLGALSDQKYSGYDFLGFQLPMQRLWGILLEQEAQADDAADFWALQDLDLEVRPGEILGIVGKNGSGKSTLLKILARVTEPSAGFAEVTGQVGSLLEVGTGFHPDLTGRQNVYLNGSIMGMTHDQIDRRFDEIVSFAEVESFIDTPVKHYSSGMYMRLAFAVAAHMECDILIVDEVLAVGDAHFQRKCLARIDSEVRSGKTVLFVSHNTSTIMQICSRCVLFERGRLIEDGLPQPVVESYLSRSTPIHTSRQWTLENAPVSPGGHYRLWSFKVAGADGETRAHFDVKEPVVVVLEWDVLIGEYPTSVYVSVRHESGVTVFTTLDNHDSPWTEKVAPAGRYRAQFVVPANFLNEGMFMMDFSVTATHRTSEIISCSDAATFYVVDDMKNAGVRGNWTRKWFTSVIRPQLKWTHFEPSDPRLLSATR
jgi:lipopolysaccharide transport system ATP-binding protein